MKKLLFTLAFVVCLVFATFVRTTSAGEIPVGGYCDSQMCVDANPAPDGYYWNYEGPNLWHMHQGNPQ